MIIKLHQLFLLGAVLLGSCNKGVTLEEAINEDIAYHEQRREIVVKVDREKAPFITFLRGNDLYEDSYEETGWKKIETIESPINLYDFVLEDEIVGTSLENENDYYPLIKTEAIHSISRADLLQGQSLTDQEITRSPYDSTKLFVKTLKGEKYYLEVPGFHFYHCEDCVFSESGVDLTINVDFCNLFWYKLTSKLDSACFQLRIHKDYHSTNWNSINKPDIFNKIWENSQKKENEIQRGLMLLKKKEEQLIISQLERAYNSKLYEDRDWRDRHCSEAMLDNIGKMNLTINDAFQGIVKYGETPKLFTIKKADDLDETYQAVFSLPNIQTKRIVEFDTKLSNRGDIFITSYRLLIDTKQEKADYIQYYEEQELKKQEEARAEELRLQRERMRQERAAREELERRNRRTIYCPFCRGNGTVPYKNNSFEICYLCTGKGTISISPNTCRHCFGKGTIPDGTRDAYNNYNFELCPVCLGNGTQN